MYKQIHLLLLFFSFSFFGCDQLSKTKQVPIIDNKAILKDDSKEHKLEANTFLISGISFTPDNTKIFLFETKNGSYKLADSTIVYNSKFNFKGRIETPKMYRVSQIKNKNKGYPLLVDNSRIHVFLNRRIDFSTAYSNSTIQKEYREYTSQMTTFKDKGMSLYYNLKGNFSSENIKKLRKERLELFSKQNNYIRSFINKHPNSYLSLILIKDNIKTYSSKTLRELYSGLSQDIKALSFASSIDSLIKGKESKIKERLPVVAIKKVSENYKGDYRPLAYKINGLNPYGESISLNSIPKGKVILVDFWASWCAPCRATNPNLVILHQKYKNQGFEILSVSEDKGESEWLNAINSDNLTWDYHVIDKNKILAFRYGVESIPFKLLIDKKGRIASENISGKALEQRIQELLAE
ncbi:TlpA disulfide reductase family protein [uncultured Lacinutrix sp.]|uniref:TlpA disulfide reductase family protein n=1 Tax=uncultured Lacinutrix sp. TaxID=574032 RepID=UPI0026306E2D|nr:TlpA disulfide reductase family protein [uncultured Lacinutrix sp.]